MTNDERKGFWIKPNERIIIPVTFKDSAGLRRLIGGYLECAYLWGNGDTLYVDEEGLLKHPNHFFWLKERSDQPFAGFGVLVGKEIGNTDKTAVPTMTLDQLKERITWANVVQTWR